MLSLFIAYVIGSIPSGYWFAKCVYGVDVTKHGSGNIGATNVARVLKCRWYFFLIFFIDFAKAFTTLAFATHVFATPLFMLFVAIALLIGNSHSIFLRFRGGKGVATTLGILAYLFPVVALSFFVVWVSVLAVSRQVGIASVVGAGSILPAYLLFAARIECEAILFLLFVGAWVVVRHRSKIKQIICT